MDTMANSSAKRIALTLVLGSCIAACDGQTEPAADNTSQSAPQSASIHIYWTAVNESGKNLIRGDVISARQKDALMAARKANAKRAAAGDESARSGHLKASTVGSQDWNDCQYYDWLLFTSDSDGSGSIFCATINGTNTDPYGIAMPFWPAWWDPSWYHSGLMCRNSFCHPQPPYCGYWSAVDEVYLFEQASSGGGNLNGPSTAPAYISVDPPTSCP